MHRISKVSVHLHIGSVVETCVPSWQSFRLLRLDAAVFLIYGLKRITKEDNMVLSYTPAASCKIIVPANQAPGGLKIPHKYRNSLIK